MTRVSKRSINFVNSYFAGWFIHLFVALFFGPLSTSLCPSASFAMAIKYNDSYGP